LSLTITVNVGIGTSAPGSKLVVTGGDVTISNAFAYILGTNLKISSATNLSLQPDSGDVLFPGSGIWKSTGNVGIGNTAPRTTLDITGSASISGNLTFLGTSNINTLNGGDFTFQNSVGGDAGLASKLILKSNGNIGLGTTAPQALLSLWDSTNFASTGAKLAVWEDGVGSSGQMGFGVASSEFRIMYPQVGTNHLSFGTTRFGGNQWTEYMRLDQNGNLGLGTTNPTHQLEVWAPSGADALYLATGTTAISDAGYLNINGRARFGYSGGSAHDVIIDDNGTSKNIRITAGGAERLTILQSNGNVGIGSAAPTALLNVGGDIKFGGTSSGLTWRMFTKTNVGVAANACDTAAGGTGNDVLLLGLTRKCW